MSKIYTPTKEEKRTINYDVENRIKQAYENKNKMALIKELLKLEKFPIKDPYIAFLRKGDETFLERNPETVERISSKLLSMDFDELIRLSEEPKEFNRQLGPMFKNWLKKLGYPFLVEDQFTNFRGGIAFLDGSDKKLGKFANEKLKCGLDKTPDFIAKVDDKFVIGEAKFLTDFGGHQDRQFEDALKLIRNKQCKAIRVAVLDGVLWLNTDNRISRDVRQLKDDEIALSALLLEEFLKSLR
ncbi:Tsp45I type II restriction enzyme [Conexivisphaera calida]|uniref:Tsp45I type II restriction enzyme n=1 Tax=Conexivisphaera calida TaxID=1874277 RepID=A0A4P2VEL3_9ARCH|nr:Tsp45I type II restriction enzyme [Conexivisphaera calida]